MCLKIMRHQNGVNVINLVSLLLTFYFVKIDVTYSAGVSLGDFKQVNSGSVE